VTVFDQTTTERRKEMKKNILLLTIAIFLPGILLLPQLGSAQHTEKYDRPIPMGVSIGPTGSLPYIFAGTAGMLVRTSRSSSLFILSNNHVIGASGPTLCVNTAPFWRAILQPGTLDIGSDPGADREYTVGRLFRKVPIGFRLWSRNKVDAAIALTNSNLASAEILGIGFPTAEVGQAEVGMEVTKSGRTTGVTSGFVEAVNVTSRVNFGEECGTATFIQQVSFSKMSDSGDSGSVILDSQTLRPVALLFADSSTRTLGNPFAAVVEALDVLPVGEDGLAYGPTSVDEVVEEMESAMNPRLERLKEIQQKHEDQIMAVPEVVGIGIGLAEPGDDYEFIVYCKKIVPELWEKLPRLLDGVPVRLIESGPFEAN
jgi:hypothetical protein